MRKADLTPCPPLPQGEGERARTAVPPYRRTIFGLLLALVLAAAGEATAQERTIQRGLAVNPDVSFRVYSLAGSIRVEGWDRDSISVTATLTAGSTDRFFFGGTRTGGKLGIDAGDEEEQPPAHLLIRVPPRARVWIKSGSADVVLLGLTGGVDVFATSGSIRFDGNPDQLNLESMDGAIDANAEGSWIRLKTASGDITLRGTGEDVGLSTVSGNLTVLSTGLRRTRVESVSGAVTFRGGLAADGGLTVETHSGAADLQVPSELEAEFDLSTYQGTITSSFPHSPAPQREQNGSALRFTSGAGRATVTVRTFKGMILLKAKGVQR